MIWFISNYRPGVFALIRYLHAPTSPFFARLKVDSTPTPEKNHPDGEFFSPAPENFDLKPALYPLAPGNFL